MSAIQAVEAVKKSTAKNVVEPKGENASSLLNFTLPDETQTAGDFIQDDKPPETQESGEAIEAVEVDENSEAEKHRGTPDKKGNPYDPLIHAFPPEMTGKLEKWKKKPKSKVDQAIVSDVKSNTSFRAEAAKFAHLYGQGHMLLFGKDGAVQDKEELVPLTDDLERYMMENGHTQMPAGYAVALSSILYSMGVCQREPNAAKVKRWTGVAWGKIKGLFVKNKKIVNSDNLDNHRTVAETSKPETIQQENGMPEAGGSY